jgi:ketosteroid isomerase-like protein
MMAFLDQMTGLFDCMSRAYRVGDAQGCAAFFTQDAILLSPYAVPTTGQDAIADLHRVWVGDGGNSKTLEVVDCGHSGDLGWCLVAYHEGGVTGSGKSLNIVTRRSDGEWLISHCVLSDDEPPLAD